MNVKRGLLFSLLFVSFLTSLMAQKEKSFILSLDFKIDSITYIEPIRYSISFIRKPKGKEILGFKPNLRTAWLEVFSKEKEKWEKMNMVNLESNFRIHGHNYNHLQDDDYNRKFHEFKSNLNRIKKDSLMFTKIAFNNGTYYLKDKKSILLRAALKYNDNIYYSNQQTLNVYFDEREKEAIRYLMSLNINPSITTNPNNYGILSPPEKYIIAIKFIEKHPESYYTIYAKKSVILGSIPKVNPLEIRISKQEKIQILNRAEKFAYDLLYMENEEDFEFAKNQIEAILEQKNRLEPEGFYYLLEVEKLQEKIKEIQKKRE